MSFDLAVWNSDGRTAEQRSTRIYESLCRGELPPELKASPAVKTFSEQLTAGAGEAIQISNQSDAHILMSCEWSRAEEAYSFVQALAQTNGLIFYDPQSDEVYLPE